MWPQQLFIDMAQALKSLGEMLFKMLFEISEAGGALKTAVEMICELIRFLVNEVWAKFMCPMMEVMLPPIINAAIIGVEVVKASFFILVQSLKIFGVNLPINDVLDAVIGGLRHILTEIETSGLQCDKTFMDKCFANHEWDARNVALPTSTRCWSGYQPSAGEPSPLSCTRADTCFDPVTQDQILCDACPLQAAEDFMSFACSALTKRCTCGVQRFERTQCTAHEQCYSATRGASCMRISDIFSTAFSTVPCQV